MKIFILSLPGANVLSSPGVREGQKVFVRLNRESEEVNCFSWSLTEKKWKDYGLVEVDFTPLVSSNFRPVEKNPVSEKIILNFCFSLHLFVIFFKSSVRRLTAKTISESDSRFVFILFASKTLLCNTVICLEIDNFADRIVDGDIIFQKKKS